MALRWRWAVRVMAAVGDGFHHGIGLADQFVQ
jgi:hypothetical protein